ncbi:MAG: phosphate/phosphite/phosphonate ABC transporter substrate-binding protein, partial [Candidatus Promineifilaceae bacterium]
LAAAVMEGKRYGDRPVYFSDIVVRTDSPLLNFADLEGCIWAYNEPNSHSGYNVVRYHLATLGELYGFFGQVIESGAHQKSLEMILNGEVDASAIDSTVLETELTLQPDLSDKLRVIESLGPSPIPPWIVSKNLPAATRYALRQTFLEMHRDYQGAAILKSARIKRFEAVTDIDYDSIREMEHTAAWVESL